MAEQSVFTKDELLELIYSAERSTAARVAAEVRVWMDEHGEDPEVAAAASIIAKLL